MAMDSNAMSRDGVPLRHFTPYPTPLSSGCNVFAQELGKEVAPYCYPPICLIGPLLCYLRGTAVKKCTLVVPDMYPRPTWWPGMQRWSDATIVIGKQGEKGVVWVHTKQGYVRDCFGLRWNLLACDLRLC